MATFNLADFHPTWIVTVCEHVNAAFIQEDAARAWFKKCRADMRDLPNVNVKLWHIRGINGPSEYVELVAQLVK